MRVGADDGIRECDPAAFAIRTVGHDRGQELEVDLVDDAGAGRDHAEVAERGLGPAQQLVALAVALVLALDVVGERAGRPEPVDLDRVVDDEVGRDERVDQRRIAAEVGHRVAHDREVHDRRDAREVLEEDPGGHERDLGLGRLAGSPGQQRLDILGADGRTAGIAEQVLEQDLDRDRQRREVDPVADGVESIQVRQACPEAGARAERVGDRCPGRHERASFVDRACARGQSAPGGCAHPGSKFGHSIRPAGPGRPSARDLLATLEGMLSRDPMTIATHA